MKTLIVTAAVIEVDGRFLVTRRQPGVHLEGHWEFPGGKCNPGEPLKDCLARELREELDVDVQVHEEVFATSHEYEDRRVELHFLSCTLLGQPQPQLRQDMRWISRDDFARLQFPPADDELIEMLQRRT